MSGDAPEWIVKQDCGHVSRWVLASKPEHFNGDWPDDGSRPCKGEPIIGWGEWCSLCRDYARVMGVAN